MTKMEQFRKFGFFFLMALGLASCNSSTDSPFEADADVFFTRKIVDGDTITGISSYVYANKSIVTATLTLPNEGGVISLSASETSSLTFQYESSIDEYTSGAPITGNYVIDVTGEDGITAQIWDVQEFAGLGFPELDTMFFDDLSASLNVSWDTVSNVQNYVVRLYSTDGNLIFNGPLLDSSIQEYQISYINSTGSWLVEPLAGETYTMSIQSFMFDAEATDYDFYYNIQEISSQDYTIVWQ